MAKEQLRFLICVGTTVVLVVSATYARYWYYTQKLGNEANVNEIAVLASFFTIPSIVVGLFAGLAFERYYDKRKDRHK